MRKRLLRSRSGFEKPESREEAIMQNILGASNVLEPSESNIEEILKSILYNTPYTKEAEFEIEKILLAIKNNGTYDGEGESRDMKILIAILNDLDYTEEAESRIEELFIEWLQQRSQIKVLEGVPPLTFPSRGLPLINYLIEGNTVQNGGVGERTGNLLPLSDKSFTITAYGSNLTITCSGGNLYFSGTVGEIPSNYTAWKTNFAFELEAGTYYCNSPSPLGSNFGRYIKKYDDDSNIIGTNIYTFTLTEKTKCYLAFYIYQKSVDSKIELMLNLGSTALPYEPYGYKIPITCGGVTTDIYIGDSPLYEGDTISMTDTGIEIPTAYGNNVLTVDTAVQPSNVYIEYK